MAVWGSTQYAKRGGMHLAYRVSDGDGPPVAAVMPGYEPLSSITEHFARPAFDRVAAFGRSVLADRLGVGESDPIDLTNPPTLDDVADDLIAVLDHAGIPTAALWGFYNAGLVAIRAAVRHPDRVSKLALVNTFVCWEPAPSLEGVSEFYRRKWEEEVEHGPTDEINMLSIVAPSLADNVAFRAWWNDVGRRGASPRSALVLGAADASWDVRDDLRSIAVPTVVVHRRDNRFVPVSHARYIADQVVGAKLVETPGVDFMGMVGDVDALWDPVEEFFTSKPPRRKRTLVTVLFTDLVDSTRRSAAEGDRRWSRLIAEHNAIARDVVTAHDGEVIKSTGDGVLAVFPSAASAIDAARSLRGPLEDRGLAVRAGIHAGEVERIDNDITGIAVTIAARVMALAGPGEVLVSGAVPPLVTGSGLEFAARGEVALKGVPGDWSVLAVT